jgi:hypothetical protein
MGGAKKRTDETLTRHGEASAKKGIHPSPSSWYVHSVWEGKTMRWREELVLCQE